MAWTRSTISPPRLGSPVSRGSISSSPARQEFDEIRELVFEDRIYRFILMQLIGALHALFTFLAFKNELKFWRGTSSLRGLSSRSVLFNAGCALVI